ncbi:hypothetical protein GCM10010987_29080 [Bradyrhizobium guangdongense]|uniref:Uncharacterized protein n=1 Tax=Bradyrhizobium guangdongense TaxID=1325090 RepID=A0AA87W3K6_9BRAD|nr:hypothetical protein GCM10010987_29080 [Bradyrhizobium guangdongense]
MRRGQAGGARGAIGGEQLEMIGKIHGVLIACRGSPINPHDAPDWDSVDADVIRAGLVKQNDTV